MNSTFPILTVLISLLTTNRLSKGGRYILWRGLILLLLLAGGIALHAQSRQDLESRRKKLIRDIELTDKMLKKTTKTRETTFDRFVMLQRQIEQRERLIRTIDAEIREAGMAIDRTAVVIVSLERDIIKMRADYSKMVRNAFRRKMLSNPLLYILSAESLNQAFRRWLFLRKYDRYRKTQAEAIVATQQALSNKIRVLEETRQKQETLLVTLQKQKAELDNEMRDKENLLNALKKDEGRLREDLQKKQAAHEALNQAIEQIIQAEIQKKVQAARRPTSGAAAANKKPDAVPASGADDDADIAEIPDDNLTMAFRQKQGRLPWPVENGVIARGFGRQKHPTLQNIEITNNGVDIRTAESSPVYAVYNGVVAGVQFIPGHDYTVILQHGNYYTVYSNLSETPLNKGDMVEAKQVIGRVNRNPITSASELHFELWHQKKRLNPASWIKK